MMISRRNFLAVAGAAAAAAALTACGGSSSSTSTASSTASSAASEAGSEAASKITKVALTCDTGTIDDESFNHNESDERKKETSAYCPLSDDVSYRVRGR